MMHYILVEPFTRQFLYEGAHHIVVQVAVLVAFAGSVVVIAFCPVGICIGIDDVKGKVALAVIEAGCMGHQKLKGDDFVRELGVAHGETGQVADIGIKAYKAFFYQLQH